MPVYDIQEAVTNKEMHKQVDNLNPRLKKVQDQGNADNELRHNYYAEMVSPFIIRVSNQVITDS